VGRHKHGGDVIDIRIEIEREDDGRLIADIPEIPGVMAYGATQQDAVARVEALALRVLADRLERGEAVPQIAGVFDVAA